MKHTRAATVLLLLLVCQARSGALAQPGNTAPEGFTLLFSGNDLSGWKGLVADPPKRAKMSAAELAKEQQAADAKMREHWKAVDGVLVFDGKGDSLCTAKDYEDFELYVDWKIEKGGDSGIYLRGSPQVQIWDNPEGSGALWNNQKHSKTPLIVADKPVGEWNSFRIIMIGDRVTVYLNGLLVVDDTPLENYWERDKPIYPKGQIELQNHGNSLYFKNIYVRELPRVAPLPPAVLKRGDLVAVVGDSITEQRLYSRFIEDYLLACVPQLELNCIQFGWGGERADGFAARMDNDLLPFKPNLVTTCYGMNDGSYRTYEAAIGKAYEENMRGVVKRIKAAGTNVVVGSPGAVDTQTFKNLDPAVYNDNLSHLRDIARELARTESMPFADVHDQMYLTMLRAKTALGKDYHVCGPDGFHPSANGHIAMAYAFLKAMGLDGQIGTITVDMAAPGKAGVQATEGHKVVSAADGKIEVESTRYPFCFYGDGKTPESSLSVVPFVPFNADLNRMTLIVHGLPAAGATVLWTTSDANRGIGKNFTREQLEAGINLAAEFPENPFSDAFKKLDEIVAKKQAFETAMIKECITRFRSFQALLPNDAESAAAMNRLRERLTEKHHELQKEARSAVTPVRHVISLRTGQ